MLYWGLTIYIFCGPYNIQCSFFWKAIIFIFDCLLCIPPVANVSPCEHGGTCVNTPGSYRCDCDVGFSGPRCEQNINECNPNPCQNEATCLDLRGMFRCICMAGKCTCTWMSTVILGFIYYFWVFLKMIFYLLEFIEILEQNNPPFLGCRTASP